MPPTKCRYEHEIPVALERWKAKYRALREDDREINLPNSWQMTALRIMLCGEIQNNVPNREKEFKTYHELSAVFMEWAINRQIGNEKSVHDPMDCNQAQNCDPAWGIQD